MSDFTTKLLLVLALALLASSCARKKAIPPSGDTATSSIQDTLKATPDSSHQATIRQYFPPVPYIQKNACPFEGCQFGLWTTNSPLKVYSREGDTTTILCTLTPGDSLIALTGNIHMERLGIVIVTKPHEQFSPGDTLYTLSYTGEGYNDVWYRGQELNIEIFWPTDNETDFSTVNINDPRWDQFSAVMVAPPLMIWWVQVTCRGHINGWIRLLNTTLAGFRIEEELHGLDALD